MNRRAVLAAALALSAVGAQAAPAKRIVSLGGVVTEIVFALGAGDRVVGVDDSSIYPAAAHKLPKVGYYRGFSIEGVASLNPDVVLASDQAGPPEALEQLRRLGKTVVMLPSVPTVDALAARIDGVASALGEKAAGDQLVARIREQVAAATKSPGGQNVLLVSSRAGKLEGAGRETAADAVLRLAGARNVLAGERGYKALSAEGAVSLKPEVIVTTTMSVGAAGGLDAFLAQPGIAVTPAAKARRVVVMDDLLLLGFGPRLPEALKVLQDGLAGRK
ncbi:hemin ABC transporter substrate-binding protein [Piscinibacter gummiphilus]|uniref:Hemin ABC transporter substrate-binding protein n=2 Tax=Piscinibacter gummiphilus TaxID=946333 RepID=A0A1W6LHX7_9BURK|nr:hemin ABC transporter substrate-binding protein [Piscinibacter gummiphilus]GLS94806.1 hemin-binding protein [Piscinibacter gummiphilus]